MPPPRKRQRFDPQGAVRRSGAVLRSRAAGRRVQALTLGQGVAVSGRLVLSGSEAVSFSFRALHAPDAPSLRPSNPFRASVPASVASSLEGEILRDADLLVLPPCARGHVGTALVLDLQPLRYLFLWAFQGSRLSADVKCAVVRFLPPCSVVLRYTTTTTTTTTTTGGPHTCSARFVLEEEDNDSCKSIRQECLH